MEQTYKFLFNANRQEWSSDPDSLLYPDFDYRSLEALFPNIEEISVDFRRKKYYGFDIVKVIGKKQREWKDYDDSDILLTDYKFDVYSENGEYKGFSGETFEDDEDPGWEIGTELERVYYQGHSVFAPIGTNLIDEVETSNRGGIVVTAPLSAIIDFMKFRKGTWLTIRNETNEDLKKHFDFEVDVASSIEY